MQAVTPHSKHRHVFAIVRVDLFHRADMPLEEKVQVPHVVWTEEAAEREVERLNRLNAEKGCIYVWRISRLVDSAPG